MYQRRLLRTTGMHWPRLPNTLLIGYISSHVAQQPSNEQFGHKACLAIGYLADDLNKRFADKLLGWQSGLPIGQQSGSMFCPARKPLLTIRYFSVQPLLLLQTKLVVETRYIQQSPRCFVSCKLCFRVPRKPPCLCPVAPLRGSLGQRRKNRRNLVFL